MSIKYRDTYNFIRLNELRVRIPSLLMQCGGMVNALDCKSDFNKENSISTLRGGVMVTHVAFVSFDTYNINMQ